MHRPASTPVRGRRRSPLPVLRLALAALLAGGCENVPPFLERSYLRGGTHLLVEKLEADHDDATGPYPGLGLALGTLLQIERTTAVALDAELQAFDVDHGGDLDGWLYQGLAGPRWFWNMDARWRPNAGVGASFSWSRLKDHQAENEPKGPGAYADVGLDWMVTPHHAIGVRLRGGLRYEMADRNNGVLPTIEFALQSSWRF